MTYVMTIQTDDAAHFEKIKKLAQKLGVATTEGQEGEKPVMSKAAQEFLKLQQKYPPKKVARSIRINDVIDEVNL